MSRQVQLRFRTFQKNLLAVAQDPETGETIMAQNLGPMSEWLRNMGYHYVVGSQGVWAKKPVDRSVTETEKYGRKS